MICMTLPFTHSLLAVLQAYFTWFLKPEHGLKVGTLCSGITTVVFFVMFLPVFAFLVFTSNVPNPRRYTFSPFAIEPFTVSMNPSTTAITVLASMPVLFDTSLTISIFVMFSEILGCKDNHYLTSRSPKA